MPRRITTPRIASDGRGCGFHQKSRMIRPGERTSEQQEWAFQPEGCGSHNGIDGTPVARKPSRPEQFTSSAPPDLWE